MKGWFEFNVGTVTTNKGNGVVVIMYQAKIKIGIIGTVRV